MPRSVSRSVSRSEARKWLGNLVADVRTEQESVGLKYAARRIRTWERRESSLLVSNFLRLLLGGEDILDLVGIV